MLNTESFYQKGPMNPLLKLILLAVTFFPITLKAVTGISIEDPTITYSVGLHAEYFEDETNQLTINQVSKEKWNKSTSEIPSFGFSTSSYWVRFQVTNLTDQKLDWYLELAHPLHDKITMYEVADRKVIAKTETGDSKPFNQRPVEHYNFVFPISLETNESKSIYIQVQSLNSMLFPLTLSSKNTFVEDIVYSVFGFGLYYGMMFVMAAYNLFLFLTIRSSAHLFYVLYITANTLFHMSLNGFGFQFLWPNWGGTWQNSSTAILAPTTYIFLSLFCQKFRYIVSKIQILQII